MTTNHYGIGTSMPEAHITRSKEKNRGRVKIYSQNTVYLEKGEEFEIEIFNPTNTSILAKIEINGELISSTGLVLKPAQRVYLERYFDVDRRFKFDVYEVENWEKLKQESQDITNNRQQLDKELSVRQQLLSLVSSEEERAALEARIDELKTQTEEMKSLATELSQRSSSVERATKWNGKIRVLFYKEKTQTLDYPWTILNSNYNGTLNLNGIIGSNTTTTGGYVGGSNTTNISNIGSKFKKSRISDSPLRSQSFSSNDNEYKEFNCLDNSIGAASFSASLTNSLFEENSLSFNLDEVISDKAKSLDDVKETGRIEQGSISNQKFETVNMSFETYTFHTVEYKMLPSSEKPMEVKDLRKYCNQCGKKLSPSDNFCSSCGKKS